MKQKLSFFMILIVLCTSALNTPSSFSLAHFNDETVTAEPITEDSLATVVEVESEPNIDADTKIEIGTGVKANTRTEADTEAEISTEAETATEADTELQTEADTEVASALIGEIAVSVNYDQHAAYSSHTQHIITFTPNNLDFSAGDQLIITLPTSVDSSTWKPVLSTLSTHFVETRSTNPAGLDVVTYTTTAISYDSPLQFSFNPANILAEGTINIDFISSSADTPISVGMPILVKSEASKQTISDVFDVQLVSGFPFNNKALIQKFVSQMDKSHNDLAYNNYVDILSIRDDKNGVFLYEHENDSARKTPYHIYQAILSPKNGISISDNSEDVLQNVLKDPVMTFTSNVPFNSDIRPIVAVQRVNENDGSLASLTFLEDNAYTVTYQTTLDGKYTARFELPDCDVYEYLILFTVGGNNHSLDSATPLLKQDTVSRVSCDYTYTGKKETAPIITPATGQFLNTTVSAFGGSLFSTLSTITIKKTVKGEYADTTKPFSFALVLSPNPAPIDGGTPLNPMPYKIVDNWGNTLEAGTYVPTDSSGVMYFSLKHNQSLIISETPDSNFFCRVVEFDNASAGYAVTTDVLLDGNVHVPIEAASNWSYTPGRQSEFILSALYPNPGDPYQLEIEFINTRISVVPTAISISDAPFIAIIGLVVIIGFAYVVYRQRYYRRII